MRSIDPDQRVRRSGPYEHEWNTYLIQVTPSALRVFLNGTLVNTLASDSPLAVDGYIGLENSSTGAVRFKSIQMLPAATVASTTTVKAAPAAVVVKNGRPSVTVAVDAGGTPVTGNVEISVGGVKTATVALVDGTAHTTLPAFASTGTKSITARYVGSDIVEPSTASTSVTVRKAASTLTARVLPRRIVAKKTKATVQIVVRAPGITPTGAVTVKLGSKTVTGTLVNGQALIRLPRFAKPGTVRGTVTYRGDALTDGVTTSVVVKVVKRR
ncbi:hypothetical protein GCM10009798_13670 [Nocardioides panacihumi]|uniref:3-keto-alpha-glucoside-1,2-lyase/3-keto-2-hydroxy-glucal hydratase domain-containing protein n=1 Tax=Nocardioides panacihumi TaxID=400774 RepID=A0ABP5C300_9ACTN